MSRIIKTVDFKNTKITDGFWRVKQDMVRNVSVRSVYNRFDETGRIEAFKCKWKPGDDKRPHHFWDSDVAKWIEGAAYIIADQADPELESMCDAIIDDIIANQGADGYFNIYYTVVEPGKRFTNRDMHELYCAGHLMEAGVAYYEATGKRALLDAMCKYADYIEKRFMIDRDTVFTTPGHQEIELALLRLYECTGENRYLKLSEFFINERGEKFEYFLDWAPSSYNQSHLPVRKQTEAVGHAVRAVYLYTGMAYLSQFIDDPELLKACNTLFDNIVNRKMYITGGIGSSSCGEAFTVDYDLPNILAYSESCAAIGLVYFANKMLTHYADSKYSDIIERIIYNGFLSSVSLDGKSFFYENPLEVMPYLATKDQAERGRIKYPRHTRLEVFNCSCCPPNIVRFIPSIANILYGDDGQTLFVHQFMNSETVINRDSGRLVIEQKTAYPENGVVKITLKEGASRVAVRIPGWYKGYAGETVNGYAYFDLSAGESLEFNFEMTPRFIQANEKVLFCAGKCAIMRGPVVYCSESCDNGAGIRNLVLDTSASFEIEASEKYGVPCIVTDGWRRLVSSDAPLYTDEIEQPKPIKIKLIPYFAFANRGPAEMIVWHSCKI